MRLPPAARCLFALFLHLQLIASAALLLAALHAHLGPLLLQSGSLTTALGGVQTHASWVAMARQAHSHPSAGSEFGRGSLPVDVKWAALVSARPSS